MLVTLPGSADEFSLAMDAMSAKNYRDSATRWKKLSQHGNLVAEYNLAISLQHIPERRGNDRDWLRAAARDKLITAYQRLQPAAIRPLDPRTNPRVIKRSRKKQGNAPPRQHVFTPAVEPGRNAADHWIRQRNPGYYTLQLASSPNRASMENLYRNSQLQGQGGMYKSRHQGENRYTLVYGAYPTANEARNAISSLPQQLQKWKPWVRNLKEVQRVMLPFDAPE